MSTFLPSKYSPKDNPDVGESVLEVEVLDPQGGLFKVEWGKVTYLGKGPANYPAEGTVWQKGVDSSYEEIIGNLSTASSSNKAKIETVLDPAEVKAAEVRAYQAASMVPAVSAGDSALPAAGGDPGGKVPLTKQKWFWPAVIVGVAVVGGGALFYFTRDREGAAVAVPT